MKRETLFFWGGNGNNHPDLEYQLKDVDKALLLLRLFISKETKTEGCRQIYHRKAASLLA